jgi:tRNA threonylcarbamoyladenosine biosynthesis protein TsaB
MTILTIRTDNPEAEIGLFDGDTELAYIRWQAHRQLAETLHGKIRDILAASSLTLQDVEGIACYAGPGSFTGLRIGLTVANSLAYALEVPVAAATGDDWIVGAISKMQSGQASGPAMPEYGAEVHVTLPSTSRKP